MIEPSYLKLFRDGRLEARIKKALALMESCRLCPRECGVNRLEDEKEGYCGTGREARVASYNAHFGEEAPLVGRYGSGTIFLSSCNLLCSFCQNYDISHLKEGIDVDPEQMAAMMIRLVEKGCHNINFVTPTHAVPQILEALIPAIKEGLSVPLVYNCGGYERKETLALLDGIFDIYMPDFKFWDRRWAERFCEAPGYREVAMEAIKEMYRQVGDLLLDGEGVAVRGLLIRHLVMPNNIAGTGEIMDFLARELSVDTYVNVMDQYRPCGSAKEDELINRRLTAQEFRDAMAAAGKAGLNCLDTKEQPRIIFGF